MSKKETFKVTHKNDKDGTEKIVEYAVVEPGPVASREAQKSYNAAFSASLGSGGLLRQRIATHMTEQGLWNDEKESEQKELVGKINEMELKIQKGGIKLTEARELAIDMRRTRFSLRELIAQKNELDALTAEGQAENARFNTLVSLCLVYNETGKPVYKDTDDYLENGDKDEAFQGAQVLASMMFQLDKNYEFGLPENKFLSKWKFVDEDLRLVNKDGQLIDTEGRFINSDGHYIDENNELVDIEGRRVDKDGNFDIEQSPFLDEKGNALSDPDNDSGDDSVKQAISKEKKSRPTKKAKKPSS